MGGEEDTSRPKLTLEGLCSADERRELDKLTTLPVQSLLSIVLGGLRIIEDVCDDVNMSPENIRDFALGGLKIREAVVALRHKLNNDGMYTTKRKSVKKPIAPDDKRRNWSPERKAKYRETLKRKWEERRLKTKEGINAKQYKT